MTKHPNDYYTYAYLREDKTPYYIGKGRGKRIHCTQRTIKAPKDKSQIIFLKKNLTEAEAFKHEVYMIFVLGRKDLGTGILRNRTDGGEGSSGAVRSAETRKKHSESKTGEKNPMFGMSGENNQQYGKTGVLSPNYGKTGALNPLSKAIIAIEPDGTQRHFGGINEAARDLEMSPGSLSTYLKYDHALKKGEFKGWKFVFENP